MCGETRKETRVSESSYPQNRIFHHFNMQNLRGHPGFELKMSQNLQPLLVLLKNSPAISAFLAAVDLCL